MYVLNLLLTGTGYCYRKTSCPTTELSQKIEFKAWVTDIVINPWPL